MHATIADLEVRQLRIPFERPMQTATFPIEAIDTALLRLRTDEGVEGVGWAFAFGPARVRAVVQMLHGLEELVVGRDAVRTEDVWSRLWQATAFIGQTGVSSLAIAAIDTACWDVKGKVLGIPVHRLLGAVRDRVEVYASQGLWLDRDLDELRTEAHQLVSEGFRAVKMRMGLPDRREDIRRLAAVRDAVGPDVAIMVDANQAWTAKQAITMSRELEAYDVCWLEEPVDHRDVAALREVRAATTVPVCSGENNWLLREFRELLTQRAVDYVMPDLMRVAGPTGFLRVGQLANAFETSLTPHLFMETSLHLAAALPTAGWQEYQPWWQPIFGPRPVVDGAVALSDDPGFGLHLDLDAVERFAR